MKVIAHFRSNHQPNGSCFASSSSSFVLLVEGVAQVKWQNKIPPHVHTHTNTRTNTPPPPPPHTLTEQLSAASIALCCQRFNVTYLTCTPTHTLNAWPPAVAHTRKHTHTHTPSVTHARVKAGVDPEMRLFWSGQRWVILRCCTSVSVPPATPPPGGCVFLSVPPLQSVCVCVLSPSLSVANMLSNTLALSLPVTSPLLYCPIQCLTPLSVSVSLSLSCPLSQSQACSPLHPHPCPLPSSWPLTLPTWNILYLSVCRLLPNDILFYFLLFYLHLFFCFVLFFN